MSPLLSLIQIISGPAGDNILLLPQIMLQNFLDIHDLRLVIYQSQHIDAKGILQLCVLEQPVQDHVGIGVMTHIDGHTHPFTA